MRRFFLYALTLAAPALAVAGCSPNETGKKIITEQCIASGEPVEVCECLAKASDQKLGQQLFDIVVLGAQGDEAETAARMEELPPELRTKFTVLVPEIRRECENAQVMEETAE